MQLSANIHLKIMRKIKNIKVKKRSNISKIMLSKREKIAIEINSDQPCCSEINKKGKIKRKFSPKRKKNANPVLNLNLRSPERGLENRMKPQKMELRGQSRIYIR